MKKRILKSIGVVVFLLGIFANTSLSLDSQSTKSNIDIADLFKIEQASAECDPAVYPNLTERNCGGSIEIVCTKYNAYYTCRPGLAKCCKDT